MKMWQSIVLGVLVGLLAGGLILLVSRQSPREVIEILPSPTLAPVLVHIDGAVQIPGVYSVPPNSHLVDLIGAAGGLDDGADTSTVNLAIYLVDGQKVHIPYHDEVSSSISSDVDYSSGEAHTLINVNIATVEELMELPGIGETRAKEIVAYRTRNGAFNSMEDLDNVDGIGETTLAEIRDLVTFGP